MFDFFAILLGALLYRWRGMAHPKKDWFPRPFNQALFALPYAFLSVLVTGSAFVFVLVWALTTLGALTGHGRGIDLGETDKGEPERLEFLIRWLKPRMKLYHYDMLLLSITGLAITIPAGIATMNPILALSGALKGPAYAVAKFGGSGTAGGELLTGAALWGLLF